MSQKKFEPHHGFIIAVHQNIFGIRALAEALELPPVTVGRALENSGFCLSADIMDLSADATKVIILQEKNPKSGLKVVNDEPASSDTSDGGVSPEGTL